MIVFKAIRLLLEVGWQMWVRLLGPRRARNLVLAGAALSTLLVIFIEIRD